MWRLVVIGDSGNRIGGATNVRAQMCIFSILYELLWEVLSKEVLHRMSQWYTDQNETKIIKVHSSKTNDWIMTCEPRNSSINLDLELQLEHIFLNRKLWTIIVEWLLVLNNISKKFYWGRLGQIYSFKFQFWYNDAVDCWKLTVVNAQSQPNSYIFRMNNFVLISRKAIDNRIVREEPETN